MNSSHPACWSDEELLDKCKLTFSRASGPGGQHRNKVETGVQIEFIPNGSLAQASELRSQSDNRKVAIQRLRCKLCVEYLDAIEPALVAAWLAHSSEIWGRYCRNGRINVSENNTDWPCILAHLMLMLRECEWDIGQGAERLETTTSQVVKTLKKHAPALVRLNAERKALGLSELC
jgi:hypothetical protein